MKFVTKAMVLILVALLLDGGLAWSQLGTDFTYQGKLMDDGSPANGDFALSFALFDAEAGGAQTSATIAYENLVVIDGQFTVELDFGADSLNGDDRWLEITVNGNPLSPRQPVNGAPYSIQTRGLFTDENENVSIGTNAPDAKLHVVADGVDTVLRVTGDVGSSTGLAVHGIMGSGRAATFFGVSSNDLITSQNNGSGRAARFIGDVAFESGDVDIDGEVFVGNRFFVGNDGYVGVGSDIPITPESQFDIQSPAGNNQYGGMFVNTDGTQGLPFYGYATAGVNDAYHYYNGGTGDWILHVGNLNAVAVETSGQVGIGTLDPNFLLEVNGSAGKPGGGSWSNSSDRRLKKNIADLDGSLDKLMKLRGVTYEYIDPKSINELEGERIGMIAQEVESVFPDWVEERKDGYKAVTFRGFEALTVEALRELKQEKDREIGVLQLENQELKRGNEELRERLAAIEAMIQPLVAGQD